MIMLFLATFFFLKVIFVAVTPANLICKFVKKKESD